MRKVLEIGGIVAAAVLVAFGIGAIIMSINGRATVSSNLKQQQIVGTSDMTPAGIKAEATAAGLKNITYPTCSVANKLVSDGTTARCFAQYMQIHALEATGGFYYSQMGIYIAKTGTPKSQLSLGGGTDNTQYAELDPQTHQPVSNGARNVWVTETALTTALNTSFMASQLALFGIVVGIALLLAGIGFGILAGAGALRNQDSVLKFASKSKSAAPAKIVPTT